MCKINPRVAARKRSLRCDPVFYRVADFSIVHQEVGSQELLWRLAALRNCSRLTTFCPRSQDCAANPEHR
jgi:hypothetical protein